MDPTLTRSEAHRKFGELYRKERSPELQKKVDQIVAETNDIFVRLDRMEKLEEELRRSSSSGAGRSGSGAGVDRSRSPGARSGVSNGKSDDAASAGVFDSAKLSSSRKKKKRGLLQKILGNQLSAWGDETGTMDVAFWGLVTKISSRVPRLFNLKEDQILAVLKCFRHAVTNGWHVWGPVQYNTVVTAYQFFSEFIKVPQAYKLHGTHDAWIANTFKMQRHYGLLLDYPDYRKTLLEDFPSYIEKNSDFADSIPHLRAVMNYLTGLESKTPSLKNAILVYYSLLRKKVETWETVMAELKLPPPELNDYRAPESIMQKINEQKSKLSEERDKKRRQIKEIEEIKSKYFKFDADGKIKVEFINNILADIIPKIFPQNLVNETLFKSIKTEPHRLLYCLMRDFELNLLQILSGSISIKTPGTSGPEETLIFKQGLMNKHLERTSQISREIEIFVKKNVNLTYNFSNFLADSKRDTEDPTIKELLQIIKKANQMYSEVLADLQIVMSNHEMAVESEKSGKSKDSLSRTKAIPIETISIGRRYIPFGEQIIANATRLQGLTVKQALEDILRNFYNYLYVFRDGKLASALSSAPRLKAEIAELERVMEHLGIKK